MQPICSLLLATCLFLASIVCSFAMFCHCIAPPFACHLLHTQSFAMFVSKYLYIRRHICNYIYICTCIYAHVYHHDLTFPSVYPNISFTFKSLFLLQQSKSILWQSVCMSFHAIIFCVFVFLIPFEKLFKRVCM